jgi:hypothetical protein
MTGTAGAATIAGCELAVWRRHPDVVVCVYDLAMFGGETVVEIMRTHPLVIIGGIVQPNPFFIPVEELLRERRERPPTA